MPKAPEPSSTCQKTTKSLPRISPKSYRHNAVPNRFSLRFSTSRTNGPRSLPLPKAGSHSPFEERSHTAAHTAKQGPSLPRPQCGFVPPAKYLIFRHAFIYIHFPVLCEPSTPAEENNPAKLPSQLCPKPLFIAFFNFSHKRPTFAFTGESGYTSALLKGIAHNGPHAETGDISDGCGITALGAFRTFTNIPGQGVRTANFAAFEPWPEVLSKNAGVAAPLGCAALFAIW